MGLKDHQKDAKIIRKNQEEVCMQNDGYKNDAIFFFQNLTIKYLFVIRLQVMRGGFFWPLI